MKFIFAVFASVLCASAVFAHEGLSTTKIFKQIHSRGVGIDKFNPTKLPCAYTADFKMDYVNDGNKFSTTGYQAGYGRYVSYYQREDVSQISTYLFLRLDIQEQGHPNSAAIIAGYGDSVHVCMLSGYADPYQNGYTQVALLNSVIAEGFSYDSKKENVVFNGQQCTQYSITAKFSATSYVYSDIYANSEGYVVGMYIMQLENDKKLVANITVSYTMKARESQFKLDPTYQGCEDPLSAIYSTPPKEANCQLDPN